MMVDVYMRDGQTTFRFAKRVALVSALKREALRVAEEKTSLRAWVKWQRDDPKWSPTRVQLMNKSSIAFVVGVPPDEAQAFLDANALAVAVEGQPTGITSSGAGRVTLNEPEPVPA